MKKLLYLTVPLIITACGDVAEPVSTNPVSSDPVSNTIVSVPAPVTVPVLAPVPNVQVDPISEQPILPVKPVEKPVAQTGSVYLSETILLAQNNIMPHIYMQVPKLIGTETLQTLKADIKEPPAEISPCYNAVLTNNVPVVDKKYQYNGWWLLGTLNNTNTNFYWATQIGVNQVGAVPSGYSTNLISDPPADVKLDLGYAQLPYQWTTQLGYYNGFPVNPDEKCSG